MVGVLTPMPRLIVWPPRWRSSISSRESSYDLEGALLLLGVLEHARDALTDAGHLAMVVGNGQMIEAGDPVKLSPIRTDNAGQGFQGFWRPTA